MITGGNKWHYIAVSNLSALLKGKSSDFYCLNCFNSYTTKSRFKKNEEICNKHDSCHIEMLKWVEKILKYNFGEKSLKAPFAFLIQNVTKKRTILSKQSRKIVHREKS